MKEKESEAPSTESESTTETESGGETRETGKTFTQEDLNRFLAKEKAKLERKYEAQINQTKTTVPAKNESPPPASSDVTALQQKLEKLEASMRDQSFAAAVAGLEMSDEDREALREVYGTKAFDLAVKPFKASKATPPPALSAATAKTTPGMTPSGPPQLDREHGLTGATKDDVSRWKADGSLLKRAEFHRNSMGGEFTFFNKGQKKRDK